MNKGSVPSGISGLPVALVGFSESDWLKEALGKRGLTALSLPWSAAFEQYLRLYGLPALIVFEASAKAGWTFLNRYPGFPALVLGPSAAHEDFGGYRLESWEEESRQQAELVADMALGILSEFNDWMYAREIEVKLSEHVAVNFVSRLMMLEGAAIKLTPVECGLLLVLCRYRGRAVELEELWFRVWGSASSVKPNRVRVNLHNIRKKMGPRGRALIMNARGDGYCLVDQRKVRDVALEEEWH